MTSWVYLGAGLSISETNVISPLHFALTLLTLVADLFLITKYIHLGQKGSKTWLAAGLRPDHSGPQPRSWILVVGKGKGRGRTKQKG